MISESLNFQQISFTLSAQALKCNHDHTNITREAKLLLYSTLYPKILRCESQIFIIGVEVGKSDLIVTADQTYPESSITLMVALWFRYKVAVYWPKAK